MKRNMLNNQKFVIYVAYFFQTMLPQLNTKNFIWATNADCVAIVLKIMLIYNITAQMFMLEKNSNVKYVRCFLKGKDL